MIVATKYIYNGVPNEKFKWTCITNLYNANKSVGDPLKSTEVQKQYMNLVKDKDDVWRVWENIGPDDEEVKKAKEGIEHKLWLKPYHVSDEYTS